MLVLGQAYYYSLSFVFFEELLPLFTTTRLLDLELFPFVSRRQKVGIWLTPAKRFTFVLCLFWESHVVCYQTTTTRKHVWYSCHVSTFVDYLIWKIREAVLCWINTEIDLMEIVNNIEIYT